MPSHEFEVGDLVLIDDEVHLIVHAPAGEKKDYDVHCSYCPSGDSPGCPGVFVMFNFVDDCLRYFCYFGIGTRLRAAVNFIA